MDQAWLEEDAMALSCFGHDVRGGEGYRTYQVTPRVLCDVMLIHAMDTMLEVYIE